MDQKRELAVGLSKADKPTLLEMLRRVGGGDAEANRHMTRLELAEAILVRLVPFPVGGDHSQASILLSPPPF